MVQGSGALARCLPLHGRGLGADKFMACSEGTGHVFQENLPESDITAKAHLPALPSRCWKGTNSWFDVSPQFVWDSAC